MNYKLSAIASALGLTVPALRGAATVSILLTDSRALTDAEKSIFFAIRTSGNDGHRFIPELYRKGVRHFVVEHLPATVEASSEEYSEGNFLVVSSTVNALQILARLHRSRFNIPVIGITGSKGKTVVKEWLFQTLHHDFTITRSPLSFNSRIGVPLSVWGLTPQSTLGIFEAGISEPEEMEPLASIIKPTIGVFTCLTEEHDEGFSSRRQKCEEKAKLFKECEYIVYNADDTLIANVISEICPHPYKIGWSVKDSSASLFISSIRREHGNTIINFQCSFGKGEISIPFDNESEIQNAIHCLAVMICLGLPLEDIASRMSGITHVETRLNVIEGVNNCMIVFDKFTPDITSLLLSLDFMNRRQTSNRTLTVILSDLQHDKVDIDRMYEACAKLLKSKGVNRFIGIGPEISRHASLFGPDAEFYRSTDEFLQVIAPGDFNNEFILIKGAYNFRFDHLNEILEARHQETVLEVNLDAIVHNFNHYRSMIPSSTGVVGMVKASAYGAGSLEVAKTLQSQGADYLAVAVLDEGVALRKAGVSMPIMVLNPRVLNYRTLFSHRLEPEIYSFDILEEVIAEGRKWGVSQYPVHIKLDTGMHRLGFIKDELPLLLDILAGQNTVAVASVFSHLAAADCPGDPNMDSYTELQLTTFDRCVGTISDRLGYSVARHILNTSGIERFGKKRDDNFVRLGLGLYGIDPISNSTGDLQPVSKLTTIITALRRWEPGTTIGYSRRGVLKRESVVATIPIGYADGLNRRLGNGRASFYVNGYRCPTIGNICMDSCMIDVTGTNCSIGDTVEIFGPNVPVTELAEIIGTIPYEVLTSVSDRVKRIYYRE